MNQSFVFHRPPFIFKVATILLMAVFFSVAYGCTLPGKPVTGGKSEPLKDKGAVDSGARQEWIRQTGRNLRRITTEQCTQQVEPRVVALEDVYMVSYRLTNQEGCITFPNGDWIYMIAHSSHDDNGIGDITLAIDNRGRLFSNEGHVCGGIIHFYSESDEELTGANDFFGRFLSDCDDCKWQLLGRKSRTKFW
jgi:hypothetical protein